MTPSLSKKLASLAAVLALVVLLPTATLAESTKVEGVIVGRSGSEIIVEYMQGTELAFLLDDSTKVSQTGGVFKARRLRNLVYKLTIRRDHGHIVGWVAAGGTSEGTN